MPIKALNKDNVLFTYEVSFTVKEEKIGEFLEFCHSIASSFKQEKGYLALRIYRHCDHVHNFILVSQWESEESMEHHLNGDTFSLLKGGAIVLGQNFKLKIGETATTDSSKWKWVKMG